METLALLGLGLQELVLIAIVAVLIFGRRLPEVGRNLGRSFMEFKRGLNEARSEMEDVQQAARDVEASAKLPAPPPADQGRPQA